MSHETLKTWSNDSDMARYSKLLTACETLRTLLAADLHDLGYSVQVPLRWWAESTNNRPGTRAKVQPGALAQGISIRRAREGEAD